ncbi:MAG TPA: ferritin-like domain-containing protein, partial [Bdellovibrionota bacterium]|nr:ferritin-like domain-containing protein [Bdellovibrionota bacterium]
SVYLHNEYRGYTQLERLLEVVRGHFPQEVEFISGVENHLQDERNHYRMFRMYFESQGRMPFQVGARAGYVDQMVRRVFGRSLDGFDMGQTVAEPHRFFTLCRLIMVTESRGIRQLDTLLSKTPAGLLVSTDARLINIFRVIRRDEPSHSAPYRRWLASRGHADVTWAERVADATTHYGLMLFGLPALWLNPFVRRIAEFPA